MDLCFSYFLVKIQIDAFKFFQVIVIPIVLKNGFIVSADEAISQLRARLLIIFVHKFVIL